MENQGGGIGAFIPLIITSIPFIFLCRRLAKDKGKSTLKYTILGCIPLVNYFAFAYLVGTPNLILDKKIDQILSLINNTDYSETS